MLRHTSPVALHWKRSPQSSLRGLSTVSSKPEANPSRQKPPKSLPNLPTPNSTQSEHAAPKTISLQYYVSRTPSNNLPVYQDIKGGTTKKLTILRKITGNIASLQQDLQSSLGLEEEKVTINQLTRQICVKGWVKDDIVKFLQDRDF